MRRVLTASALMLGALMLGALMLGMTAMPAWGAEATQPADPLRAWVGLKDAAGLENWVQWHLGEERRLIAGIEAVKGKHTVENTLAPYDEAQRHLSVASDQSYILFAVHPEKAIRDKGQALAQVVSAEATSVNLNQAVYQALKGIDVSGADAATKHYVDRILLEYRLGGVDKDEPTRAKVRKLQDQITEISLKFGRNVQDDVRKVPATREELDGLPADYIARHKPDANGSYTLTTDSPDFQPVITYAASAKLRRTMFVAYYNRAYPGNEAVLKGLLEARQELATTLGYPRWADLATADMMIGSAAKMKAFLNEVDEASKARAHREVAQVKAFAAEKDPAATADVSQADANYWNEQYRRAKYDFDSQSVRPYFPYEAVEKGVLATAAKLFHVEFRPAADAPVWDPAVHAYDVLDGGQKAGRIYLDMHPREGKDKWFSESQLIPGKGGVELPEATLVCNFSGGMAGDPGLMQYSEVVTFFHEFGHMMHEVLGGRQRWAGQSGVSTESDFVEAPSQMLEEMFHDTAILQGFARHYQTGEVLPTAAIERMNQASYFGRGNWVQQQLLFSTYALQLHDETPASLNLDALWSKDVARFNGWGDVPGTHMFASFTHLTGYSSNYYTYVLDKVIAMDFFSQFDEKNLLNGPTALRYRRSVLEPGSSKPAAELVKDFLGRPQSVEALKTWMDREYKPAPGLTRAAAK